MSRDIDEQIDAIASAVTLAQCVHRGRVIAGKMTEIEQSEAAAAMDGGILTLEWVRDHAAAIKEAHASIRAARDQPADADAAS